MAFTVNPAEAQAMQEDQAQLLGAIAQATRGLITALDTPRSQQTEKPETMRIQIGRRIVFGQMANGQFRNELDADRLKTIFDALQRPATENIALEKYKGKVPAIEIRDGNNVLFREESDGVVTVNQIELQLQQQKQSEENTSDANPSQDQAHFKNHFKLDYSRLKLTLMNISSR
ncbi:hypothetical protein ACKFKF_15130 [Phormidesmis sp. 146-12]